MAYTMDQKIGELANRMGWGPGSGGSIAQKVRKWRFEKQSQAASDTSKRKSYRTSRRAGKSECLGTELLEAADNNPESVCPYVTLTKGMARMILWPKLKRLNRQLSLGLEFHNTELKATLPNDSIIWLTGADKQDDIDKLRGGDKGHPLVVFDEAQAMTYLRELVEEVVEPAVLEYDGTIIMAGTPNAACAGYFFDGDTGIKPGWSSHHWTLRDNEHIQGVAEYLERKKIERGWTEDNPIYQREFCGRWVRSLDSLLYPFDEARNTYATLPTGGWRHVLGVDLGYNDDTAFSVVGFDEGSPDAYGIEAYKKPGMVVSEVGDHVDKLISKYKGFARIVVDSGGLGKMIIEELKKRRGLPLIAAEKQNKYDFVELLASDLRAGRFKVQERSPVIDEWRLLQWDEERKKEDDRFPNHLSDATLYAWREAKHWMHEPAAPKPARGTPEHFQQLEEEMEEAEEEQLGKSKSAEWWER